MLLSTFTSCSAYLSAQTVMTGNGLFDASDRFSLHATSDVPSFTTRTHLIAFTSSADRRGFEMTGPFPLTISNSTPSAGKMVRMSENMITPSVLKDLHG